MCEFKVKKVNDDAQLAEEVVVLGYNEKNELLLRDIIGGITKLDSALIYDVNTLNQTCELMNHPLIKQFLDLLKEIQDDALQNSTIEQMQHSLEQLKK
jgi:hypothetical protein